MLTACTLLFSCQWWCVWPVKSALSSTAELIPPLCSKTCFALVLRANAATSFTTAPISYQRVHLCSLPQKHYSWNLKISWCFSFTTVFYKVDGFLTLCRKSWNIYYEEKRCGEKRAYFILWRRSLQSIFFLSVLMLLHISLFYIDLGSPFFKLSTKLPQQQQEQDNFKYDCAYVLLYRKHSLSFVSQDCCLLHMTHAVLIYVLQLSDKWRNLLLLNYFSLFYCLLAPVSKFSINNEEG